MSRRVRIRSSKYLNNIVEQDHRRIKQRIMPMLGFKRFDTATVTISGIELAEKIKKAQFKTGKLTRRPVTTPAIWAAVLAAEQLDSPHPFVLFQFNYRICTRTCTLTWRNPFLKRFRRWMSRYSVRSPSASPHFLSLSLRASTGFAGRVTARDTWIRTG